MIARMTVFLVSSLSLCLWSYNGPNRIHSEADKIARCMDKPVPEPECEARRLSMLKAGCISQEEYETLKKFGSFAICMDFGDGIELQSWCPCGCFHPDSMISVSIEAQDTAQTRAIEITNNPHKFKILHLSKNTSFSQFELTSSSVKFSTTGLEEKPLVAIEIDDGRILRLTEKHPVLTAKGTMIFAKDLNLNDLLVDQNGKPIKIANLTSEQFDGEVVNFMIDEEISSMSEHVIFANRIAVGDLAWQSSLEDEISQVFIRQ